MNPYHSPNAVSSDETAPNPGRIRSSIRSAIAYSVWAFGTFLLTLLVLFDFLIGPALPGGTIYVACILGPIFGVCGAITTKQLTSTKICMVIATICLLPIQFIIIGTVLIATTGLEGIQ